MGNQQHLPPVVKKQTPAQQLLPPLRLFEVGLICKYLTPSDTLTKCMLLSRAWYQFSKTLFAWSSLPRFSSDFLAPCHKVLTHLQTLNGMDVQGIPGDLLCEKTYQIIKSAQSVTIRNLSSLDKLEFLLRKSKLLSILTKLEINLWSNGPDSQYPGSYPRPHLITRFLQPFVWPHLQFCHLQNLKELTLLLGEEQTTIIKQVGSIDFSGLHSLESLYFLCEGEQFSIKSAVKINGMPLNLQKLRLQLTGHYYFEPTELSLLSELQEITLYCIVKFHRHYQKAITHLPQSLVSLNCSYIKAKWLDRLNQLTTLTLAEQNDHLTLDTLPRLFNFEVVSTQAPITLIRLPALKKIILQRREEITFSQGIGTNSVEIKQNDIFKIKNLEKYPTYAYSLKIGDEPRVYEVAPHERCLRDTYLYPKLFTEGLNFRVDCLEDLLALRYIKAFEKSITIGVDFELCSRTSKFQVSLPSVETLHIQGSLEWMPLTLSCPNLHLLELHLPEAQINLCMLYKLKNLKVLASTLTFNRFCNTVQKATLEVNTINFAGKKPVSTIKELTLVGARRITGQKKKFKFSALYFLKSIQCATEALQEVTRRAPYLVQITLNGEMKEDLPLMSTHLRYADIRSLSKLHGVLKVANQEVKKKVLLIE